MNSEHLYICIVGAGPRGMSVLERICARERKSPAHDRLTVHLVDPAPAGPGMVWRTSQPRDLLMNTVACQVTVFTDTSVPIDGPIEEGPSLYEWAQYLVQAGAGGNPAVPCDDETLAEARSLGPDSYPTRVFYGHYLEWVFQYLVTSAPTHMAIQVHTARAVALDNERGEPDGPQTLLLDNGSRLSGLDVVVLAQGHLPAVLTPEEHDMADFARTHGLVYIAPANPADVDLSDIAPGQKVLLRGLGLNFFDHMALLTIGRGGSFQRVRERLVYRPSGKEPRIIAGSRRGVPYHARGENEKGAHGRYEPKLLTAGWVAALRDPAGEGEWVDFRARLWPLIAREVQGVYYEALLAARGADTDLSAFVEKYLACSDAQDEDRLLDSVGIAPADRWDWEAIARPYKDRAFADADDFRTWLLEYLHRDVAAARAGNVSGPLKAALDVLRDLRNEVRLAVDHSGLEGMSHRDDLEGWYTPLNAFLSIGPPTARIEELAALIEAGVVEVVGPGLRVSVTAAGTGGSERSEGSVGSVGSTGSDLPNASGAARDRRDGEAAVDGQGPAFLAESRLVPGPRLRATALVEARLPRTDLRATADPLLRHLLRTGQCRPYRIPDRSGSGYETGGLAVSQRPYLLLDAEGRIHPRRFAYGVPTESVHWVTAAGIRPGVGSVTLEDSDAIADAVLSLSCACQDGAVGRRRAFPQPVRPQV